MKYRPACITILLCLAACGGGGGGSPPAPEIEPSPPPPPSAATVSIFYLRATPAYDGWGLHLWGDAVDAATATTWNAPRGWTRIEGDAAVFDVPIVNENGALNFIAHNGDLKSPVYDLSIVPATFGNEVWVVQDEVASLSGATGTPFASESAARAALATLGNKSASLDLSAVTPIDADSGLDTDWAGHASFMEIYVRGFQDSDGDGIGDFRGLISRLDYLQALGVNGLWLMPITESADNDHGYAVEDYRDVEADYGSMADFEALVAAAHARGIAIVIDYVMNHAASTNPLFLDATTTDANDKRDWFVWASDRPRGWNTFAGDPWRNAGNGWYYGVFSALMPDFNLRNPAVLEYHRDNLRFWLNKGVDGFRFDAVGVLIENGAGAWEDQPETHELLADVASLVDSYSKRYLVCEAPSDPSAYARATSCGRAFAFQASAAILDAARSGTLSAWLVDVLRDERIDSMPLFLSNHDRFAGDRVWNQLDADTGAYRLAAATYLLAARNPFTYYGEEIGISNAASLGGDHAIRTPMSWNADPLAAGFSTVTPFRSLADNYATDNVDGQQGDAGSLLEYYRSLYALRNAYPVLGSGALELQSTGGDPVLVLSRNGGGSSIVVAINYADSTQAVRAATSLANAAFDPAFGTIEGVTSDGAGDLVFELAPRSVIVYASTP